MSDAPRLLVTGHGGFVAGFVRRHVRADTSRRWQEVEWPPMLDLRDGAAVREFIRTARPDAVVHLAAQSNVPESFRDPQATFAINITGTLNLLQALTNAGFAGRL